MGFETGLYGQDERTVAAESAFEERCRDLEAEHKAYARRVRTELHYRKVMARLVLAEMWAVKDERELRQKYIGSNDDPMGFLGDFLLRVCNVPVARRQDCLQRLGRVANQMERDGWHRQRMFTALNCAVPMALHMRRQQRGSRRRPAYRPPAPGSMLEDLIDRMS